MKKAMASIGGLFFKTVETNNEPKVQAPAPVVNTSQISNTIPQEDQTIKEQLMNALANNNLQGYDYFEFAKAIKAQEAFIPTEALRYQSAFAAASATDTNVSVNSLVSSAMHYLTVLKNQETEFLNALENHSSNNINAKEQEALSIDDAIKEKAEMIKKITEEMNVIQQKKTQLMNEAATAKAEVEKVKNNFYATLNVVTGKINSDVDKIKSYITQGAK